MGRAARPRDALTDSGFPALLARLARDFEQAGVGWALVGGLAVGAQTEPRFTRDLDVAIRVDSDAEAEAVVRQLLARGYQLEALLEHEILGRVATVRLRLPDVHEVVDLLFSSSGIESEIVAGALALEVFPGQMVSVACRGDLIAMKLLSRDDAERPQDRLDLQALLRSADNHDLERAQQALQWITQRGLHRGRDLFDLFRLSRQEFAR